MFGDAARSTALLAVLAVVLAVVGGALVGGAAARTGPSVGFSGVAGSITVGETDAATVSFADVSDADGVGSFTVNVTYDPSAVSVSAASAGAFTVRTATPEAGVLRATGYTDRHPGPTGDGTLFSLSVTGESADGAVSLGLDAETFTDADGNDLSVSTGSATLAVEAADGGGDGGDGGDGGGGGGLPGGGEPGEVAVVDGALLNGTVSAGAPVVARVDLSNPDPASGRITLRLRADGSTLAERSVSVRASTDRTVYLATRFASPGTYALAVNGVSVGTVTVEGSATPATTALPGTPTTGPGTPTAVSNTPEPTPTDVSETDPPRTTAGDGAGFGVVVALVAVGLALVARRRD